MLKFFRDIGVSGGIAGVVVIIAAIPLIFVVNSSLQLSTEQWFKLWDRRLPELLWNTLSLAGLVAVGALVIGVVSAWLVARRTFPGRLIAVWLMILPLAVPTYVLAHIYTDLLSADGWLSQLWQLIFGDFLAVPQLFNLWGVAFILCLASFSYIFLLARMALANSSRVVEEAARIQGATRQEIIRRITLPLLRPALAAGLALVVLHVLSDFGAVSMLRYQTFTQAIYLQMSGRFDYLGAAGLSFILVILSMSFLVMERFFRRQQRFYSTAQSKRFRPRKASRTETVLIWSWLGILTLLSFGLPLAWMITWSWQAFISETLDYEFVGYVVNSLYVAFIVATITICCAFPIGIYHVRRRSVLSNAYVHLSSVGFVLPGPVIALGIISFMLTVLPMLYGGVIALIIALMIRFLPLAVQTQESSMQQLTPSIEQAGRIHGAGPIENMRRVILPMIKNGMIAAWVLVFIDVLKELPATLILRPVGFDTLPVRIWIEASEEMLEFAAPAALMLVISTLPALWIIMRNESSETSAHR